MSPPDVTARGERGGAVTPRADPGLLEAVFAATGAGLCLLDPSGTVLLANRELLAMTGLTEDQALGRSIWELFPGSPPELRALHERARSGGALRVPPHAQRLQGQERWYEGSLAPVPMAGDTGLLITAVEITQRHRAEEALARARRRQDYLLSLSDALRGIGDPVEVERRASRFLGEALGASRVHYAEVVEGGEMGVVRADYHPGTFSVVGRHRFDDHGPTVMAEFRAGRTLVVDDVETDPRLTPAERQATRGLAIGAYVILPLVKAGRPVAVLVAHHAGPHAWSQEELGLMQETAERTWAAIARAHAEAALVEEIQERRRAEERLARERERLDITLQSIGDAVIATDAAGRISLLNPVAERLTGWSAAEALGRPVGEVFRIVSEDSGAAVAGPVERVLREGVVVGLANHTALVSRSGSTLPIADSGAPIRDPDGRVSGAVLVFRDQSDERRAERALREDLASKSQLARVAASVPGAVCSFRLSDDGTGAIPFSTAALHDIFGLPGELLARDLGPLLVRVHAEDQARVRDEMACAARGHARWHSEFCYLHPTAGLRWIETWSTPQAEPDGSLLWHGYVADVSARRRAELALGESEGRFRAIFEQAAVGIAELDGRSGRFLRVNDRLCEILARPRDAVLERRWQDVTHPDDLALDLVRWETFQADGRPYAREKRYLRPDGTAVWVELTLAPMELREGGPVNLVSVVQDVTDRKRGEEARRGLEEQLRQAQKLESVGRLAGGVAHDFNNLLTVILSCTSGLEETLAAGRPACIEEVREIRAAGMRAAELTRQLLAFARKQVITPVPLDLDAVVRESERLLHRVLGEDVSLVVRPPTPGLWRVLADRGQVEQVILNLAVNARDAMPGGGTLTIETANLDLGGGSEVAPGEYVRLRVQDSGQGMAPEVMAHLFEPFFTTKPVGRGTGLGLATVYGIVKQSGGTVRAESTPGLGTTFDVFLPRTRQPRAPAPRPAPGGSGGTEGVLVVEDDPRVREVTVRALRGAGYAVTVAASPREALALGKEALSAIRLLLTDVVMPGLDGRTLAEALRPRRPGLRVLFLSGYPQEVIAARGVIDSGIEFLAKPFTGPALLERVRAVLDAPAVEADGR